MDPSSNHKIERLLREQHTLTEVAKTLSLPLELPELLNQVLAKIAEVLVPAEASTVMLWDQSSGLFRTVAAYGFELEQLKKIGLRAGESITGKTYDEGRGLLLACQEEVAAAMADMRPANRAALARSLGTEETPICTVTVPITASSQKFGVLVLETIRGPEVFTPNDLTFVQILADLIALSIDRARLEAKADSVRQAREAEQLRSEVMATLSHELRLPLTAIKGYSTALLMSEIHWNQDQFHEFLELIDEEANSMESMIKDILNLSLIDVNQLNVERQPMRLQYMAREVATEIQRRAEMHRLVVDFPNDFPLVNADARWIKQVIRNILENAIKYSPEGGLVIIRGEARQSDIVVSTADQGIGISPEDLIPLFEKFFRVRSALSFHVSGTGLGLPIARSIIEAHGGRIWVESKVGQGTTVYFSLPKAAIPLEEDL